MPIKSSFCGKLDEICGIALDNFERDCLKSRAFFLSHFHEDHIQGLFSHELLDVIGSDNINIYMSEISKDIALSDKRTTPRHKEIFERCFRVLLLGSSTYITLPNLFGYKEEYVNIITLPAGHCIGSVMFLFSTNAKIILYTGDFHISKSDVEKIKALHKSNGEPLQIDALYIDTTFIDKMFAVWPKRSQCINEISNIISNWLSKDSNNRIAFGTSAKYGYEYLFQKISEKLGRKVFVGDDRLKIYRKHSQLRDIFTDDHSHIKLHICKDKYGKENYNHSYCGIMSDDCNAHYLFIKVSAMRWYNFDLEMSSIKKDEQSNKVYYICFPTHCSRDEVLYFINYFSPLKIVGFPNKYLEPKSSNVTPQKSYCIKAKKKKSSPSCLTKTDSDKKIDENVIRRLFEPIN